jgi:hypothetical protein
MIRSLRSQLLHWNEHLQYKCSMVKCYILIAVKRLNNCIQTLNCNKKRYKASFQLHYAVSVWLQRLLSTEIRCFPQVACNRAAIVFSTPKTMKKVSIIGNSFHFDKQYLFTFRLWSFFVFYNSNNVFIWRKGHSPFLFEGKMLRKWKKM